MIQINASPELCYVLWLLWLASMFLLFAVDVLWASFNAKRKRWGWFLFWIIMCFIQTYNVIWAVAHVNVWYNILAKLKGW